MVQYPKFPSVIKAVFHGKYLRIPAPPSTWQEFHKSDYESSSVDMKPSTSRDNTYVLNEGEEDKLHLITQQ